MAYRIAAEILLVLHIAIVLVIVFGFLIPTIWYLYVGCLAATLTSDMLFGYCILSKWEFDLRKKQNPSVDYNYTWTTYYTYKITNVHISDTFYWWTSLLFLSCALTVNIYFHYLFN